MTPSTLLSASRFYQRWSGAAPERPGRLAALASSSLAGLDFAALLQEETSAGLSLPLGRAMRRLRNLLVCALIRRDLDGAADLDEVVTVMSAFADFAIRTHLEALMAEMTAAHGVPIGAESGEA
ncbi:MAG TPA: bifunctional glutamine synthetase adenylyltransferase/deadenyltransferase, partial [Janthinobacterium sp.]|nr:bifunctional glutamine synthetase adenylyltransferase/deadenyltransferase [Janthinobacterium sp.]